MWTVVPMTETRGSCPGLANRLFWGLFWTASHQSLYSMTYGLRPENASAQGKRMRVFLTFTGLNTWRNFRKSTWEKVKLAAPFCCPGSFSFSWFLACLFSSFQWPKDKFKFLISSREPGERQQAPNTGNHVERISYLLQFPFYFPSPSLRPHLQPHCVSQLFPASQNRRQFTSAP